MKKARYLVALGISLIGGVWVFGAVRAGLFILNRSKSASAPTDSPVEPFSQAKKFIRVGPWNVAYIDQGVGDPIILLHGCPFQAYEYSRIVAPLARNHRVITPDLLGLGDTVVRLDDDYRLPKQVEMVVGLMDRLGVKDAFFVWHDHGAAICQLMMKSQTERLRGVVLTNAEAYDLWPSGAERLDVELVVNPVTTPLMRVFLSLRRAQRWIYRIAVHDQSVLTDEVLTGFTRPNMATPERWLRLRRFLRWQLDRNNNLETARAVDGMRQFKRPTLILWGRHDTNFGPAIAERLARDIPGVVRVEWLENSAHLPMLEQPEAYARAVERFVSESESLGR